MYQKFCVEYCSVHFLRKIYANMVPSDKPKGGKKFNVLSERNLCVKLRQIERQVQDRCERCRVPVKIINYNNSTPAAVSTEDVR